MAVLRWNNTRSPCQKRITAVVLCVPSVGLAKETGPVTMEEKGHQSRVLLECSLSDKLCVVQEQQYEVIVVPALLVGAFLILLAIILWLFIRGQRSQRQRSGPRGIASVPVSRDLSHEASGQGEKVFLPLKETSVESFLRAATPSLAKLQVPREQLSLVLEKIHNGRCGTLYHAMMTTRDHPKPKSVVLKVLEEPTGLQEVKDFIGRIQFYQYLGKHQNLVQLEGCCTERLPLYMVLEDVVPGDLLSFLWTCRKDVMTMDGLLYDLTEKQIYHIGKQVLLALLEWLHAREGDPAHITTHCDFHLLFRPHQISLLFYTEFLQDKHLFHGDVAARNILIQSDLTVKLCRLGLAYEVHTQGAISSARNSTIPLKWLAPERLLLRPASIRGDVWSFGILLYEMVTLGAPPYPEVPPASILQYLQRRKIMKRPSSCTHTMYNIMKSCWHWSENNRPLPRELHLRLEAASRSANDKAVLQVPELVVPELYADVAGITAESLSYSYSIL